MEAVVVQVGDIAAEVVDEMQKKRLQQPQD